jgi:cell division protein FtsL
VSKGLLIRLLICIFILGGFLYTYIDKQNDLTELKMEIPKLVKSLKQLEEENAHLSLEIEQIESPDRLIKLLRQKEYSHLRYPYVDEVVVIDKER